MSDVSKINGYDIKDATARADSGWINVTFPSSSQFINYNDTQTLIYRKVFNTVEIIGQIKSRTAITGSTTFYTIFTLPEGYRPNRQVEVLCSGSGNGIWLCTVNPDGEVNFSRYRTQAVTAANAYADITTSTWLPLQVTFFV